MIVRTILTSAFLLTGCAPAFLPKEFADPGSFAAPGSTSPQQLKFICDAPAERGTSEKSWRRLSKAELVNTLEALLGSEVVSQAPVRAQINSFPSDKLVSSVNDLPKAHADDHPLTLLNLASQASEFIFSDPTRIEKLFGSCATLGEIKTACAKKFIDDFGARVMRRPLNEAEKSSYLSDFNSEANASGLKRVLMRFLISPSLAFHIEIGRGLNADGTRVHLTDYEIASRISYRLAQTMPDAELFRAAAQGELRALEQVKSHAKRFFLASATSKSTVEDFFRFFLQLDQVADPFAPAGALNGIETVGLGQEMVQETMDFVHHVTWTRKAPFRELLTSREVFPRTERMAKILETEVIRAGAPGVTTPDHAGLLLRPSFLASADRRTKPVHRAVVIRNRMLCEPLGEFNPSLLAKRLGELEALLQAGELDQKSNRDRLALLTEPRACMGCHASINPIGFALEGYDQLGMPRTTETLFDSAGGITAQQTLDTRVEKPFLGAGAPESLNGAMDLVEAISESAQARACFAQTVFEYQRLRSRAASDSCALREAEIAAGEQGSVIDVFIASVANEDLYYKAP